MNSRPAISALRGPSAINGRTSSSRLVSFAGPSGRGVLNGSQPLHGSGDDIVVRAANSCSSAVLPTPALAFDEHEPPVAAAGVAVPAREVRKRRRPLEEA